MLLFCRNHTHSRHRWSRSGGGSRWLTTYLLLRQLGILRIDQLEDKQTGDR